MRNRRKQKTAVSVFVLLTAALLAGCSGRGTTESSESQGEDKKEKVQQVEKEAAGEINDYQLRDKDDLYKNDDETSVITMYLTVSKGNPSENTDHTWSEINTYSVYDYDDMGVDRYQVNALLQVGNEEGPQEGQVGYAETTPNAVVNVRGQTSSRSQQKNYKIELKNSKGKWRGQRTINLNKHIGEGLRFRNKLAYDMMKEIPQMMSLRTQFVHLYVKDETGGSGGAFQDYGLYTQVEQLNKTGMRTHGLDSNGQLYKINSCEFYRYEDVIKKEDEAGYDKKKFEQLLEIKGSSDHTKLIQMLEDVNDTSIPIADVLDQYFDRENLTYWMAYHILTGNEDTQNRNMYIYSPMNSDKWYFISWDNDGSLMDNEREMIGRQDRAAWEYGISNYWGNVLFQRCLKSKEYRSELDAAIQDLRKNYLTKAKISQKTEAYKSVVKPYVYRMPDSMYAPLTSEQYDQVASGLFDVVEFNYQKYLESLENPMPFYIGVPTAENGKLKLMWDGAYDFGAEDITYTVEVAKDYAFQQVIYKNDKAVLPEAEINMPEAGQYFIRVSAKNKSGKQQDAFDYYVIDTGKVSGVKCFYVQADGTIGEDVYEE